MSIIFTCQAIIVWLNFSSRLQFSFFFLHFVLNKTVSSFFQWERIHWTSMIQFQSVVETQWNQVNRKYVGSINYNYCGFVEHVQCAYSNCVVDYRWALLKFSFAFDKRFAFCRVKSTKIAPYRISFHFSVDVQWLCSWSRTHTHTKSFESCERI